MGSVKLITSHQAGELCRLLSERGVSSEEFKIGLLDRLDDLTAWIRDGTNNEPGHLINYDARPVLPYGWRVQEHQILDTDSFSFYPECMTLYKSGNVRKTTDQGRDYWYVDPDEFRIELTGKPVLNANVLDWLLYPDNQQFIPQEWKNEVVHFFGTVYLDDRGLPIVRHLWQNRGRWEWGYSNLRDGWSTGYSAVLYY